MSFTMRVRGDSSGLILSEFLCAQHGRFDALVSREAESSPCPACNAASPWTPSAPLSRVRIAEVTRGKFEKPEHPGHLDTRALADGMPLNEWKAKRDAIRKERLRKHVKERLG